VELHAERWQETFTGRGISPTLTKNFLQILLAFPEEIFVGKFPAVSKILKKQLPTKVLSGSANPWQNRQETSFQRIYRQIPQEIESFFVVYLHTKFHI